MGLQVPFGGPQVGAIGSPVHKDVTVPLVPLTHVAVQTPPAAVLPHAQVALGLAAGCPGHVAAWVGTGPRRQHRRQQVL